MAKTMFTHSVLSWMIIALLKAVRHKLNTPARVRAFDVGTNAQNFGVYDKRIHSLVSSYPAISHLEALPDMQ
jgi:hypothetical protein